ncbi:MAG: AraC family transcriptional regulator [Clostridiales bacterium]|nr:AraC family transcriptional regulator [Clostridiales bacterium]
MNKELMDILAPITKEEQAILDGRHDIDADIYMDAGSSTINSKKLLSSGKLITVRPHTRFVHFPKHSHNFIEVIYMCSGTTTHIVNGNKLVLKEGELLFLGQNANQEILPAGINDIAVNFIILPEFFDVSLVMLKDEETPLRAFIINSLKSNNSNSSYMHFKVADVLPIQNLVENLIWTLIKGTSNKRKINSFTMGLIFLQLMDYTDRLVLYDKEEQTILKVLKYADENYRDGSLTELASSLHYDFSWLSREIKRKTGKTYTEIVQEKRLSQASFLLTNTDMNISDIANQVGYDNVSYFHRLFKKRFNMSPYKYKNSTPE